MQEDPSQVLKSHLQSKRTKREPSVMLPENTRKIIHIDMDCFYAAIEMRDDPRLTNKPIAVGGYSDRRGVLCTCNYIARQFGVRAAMPTKKAYQLCPDLLVVPPKFEKYKAVSNQIRTIFKSHTDKVEPLSLDEAYLDVTDTEECQGSATWLAEKIRKEIFEVTQLTASAGIAPNKFLAKVASDWRKPNGQFVITPTAIETFVKQLPVQKIFGVGKVMTQRLYDLGIQTCAELQKLTFEELSERFGVMGKRLYELCRGIDNREIELNRERKSISVEHTFSEDLSNLASCLSKLPRLIVELQQRSQNKIPCGIKSIFVKIKFNDFSVTTADASFNRLELNLYQNLLQQAFSRKVRPVRLIGVGLRLNSSLNAQLELDM